ncbi:MAG: hypothetical protein CVV56_08075 [Tenericutes bacterium HGW-Tenericutes-1]|jgi:hypothetical protein|nr:MAG: hypothetical protein CVV56_08075 [Tenericutes bacterium HGW-Tenericutes-1]PKM95802.1 MAG: hypothetical protein CVU84_03105 [Firmicutes bacterium HGW-Firmicutes-1]
MAVIVKKYKVRSNKIEYNVGEIVEDLSIEDEEMLIEKGYCSRVDDEEADDEEVADSNDFDLSKLNIEDAKKRIQSIDDIDQLDNLLEQESSGKSRKGLVEFIETTILEHQAK